MTLGITLASLLLGLTIALLIVLLQFSRFKPLSAVANGYTDILRGAPLALLILLFFFGGKLILTALALPPLWISDTTFAVLSISVSISPYFAEMMRSAWRAVDTGQKEAIISLNIPWHKGMLRIIFPQGLIIAIPVFGNLLINLREDDLTGQYYWYCRYFWPCTKISQNSYGAKQVAAFISVIIVYWVLNSIILYFTTRIEKKYQFLLE
ncbi:ABC transporter permease subunit [Klebsiella variicola subsp. variicola]|nr:ABC transporter permease subunit [Klebsiella variicola subsp. variicola]